MSTAAYGIANHAAAGLAVALAGVAVFLGVAAFTLYQFRRINGVRVDGLASQIVLGAGATLTSVYVVAFGSATWAALSRAGGSSRRRPWRGDRYAFGALRWWHAYQQDPAAHAGGASPRMLAALTALACLGLVALLVAS